MMGVEIQNSRNTPLDAMKGFAIIAVVLYHFGGGYFRTVI